MRATTFSLVVYERKKPTLVDCFGIYSPIDGIRTAHGSNAGKKLWNKEDWEGVFGNASAIAVAKSQALPMVDNGMNGMAYALDTRAHFGRCDR